MKQSLRHILFIIITALIPFEGYAADAQKDSINRLAPDFVTASLVIASPGEVLYSCVGHAFLRMQCPTYKLDYVFTYESEDVRDKILTFFAGKLKMGMFCIPTKEYIQQYKQEGRGLKQYKLNLTPEAKQRLWQILDERVAEGADLPYDYLQRGCAQSCLNEITAALDGETIDYAPWPEKYDKTIREIFAEETAKYSWTIFFIQTITGIVADKDCSPAQKVVLPVDLVEVLQTAQINGTPIITEAPQTIFIEKSKPQTTWFTPMLCAVIILIVAIFSLFIAKSCIDWLLLAIETIMGLFLTYLVFFSSLPCTDWNWLLIPFNPLPAVLWYATRHNAKWRKRWTLAFAIILIVWDLVMIFYPHQLTDWAYVALVLSFIIMYLKPAKCHI